MRTPLVYDGRNIYETKEMKESGIEYHSVGKYEELLLNGFKGDIVYSLDAVEEEVYD